MKRGLVLLLTIVMLTTIITGCSSKESDKLKIGVLIYKYDDTYISTVRQALEAEGKNDPEITLLMNDSQNDQSKQNDQIDILIEKGVDALIVNIVDIGAAMYIGTLYTFAITDSMNVPILLAVSPLEAILSAPTTIKSTFPSLMRVAATLSEIKLHGIPSLTNSQLVSLAPCSLGLVSSAYTNISLPE